MNPKGVKILPKFKAYGKKLVRNVGKLNTMLKTDTLLKRAFNSVFNKNFLKRAGIAATVGVGAHLVIKYIDTNSGCFLKDTSNVRCKVRNFSCCQKNAINELPFCPEDSDTDPCGNNFDEDKENSCCRLCSCEYYDCQPGQKLECQRPSIGEALSHFTSEALTGIAGLIPGLDSFFYIVAGFILLWIILTLFRKQG